MHSLCAAENTAMQQKANKTAEKWTTKTGKAKIFTKSAKDCLLLHRGGNFYASAYFKRTPSAGLGRKLALGHIGALRQAVRGKASNCRGSSRAKKLAARRLRLAIENGGHNKNSG
jgi:hypothetical protein